MRISPLLVFCYFLLASPARAGEGDLSLLVIDADSYLAQQAVAGLDLPAGFQARAFAALFVLAVVGLFFLGLRRRRLR